MNQNLYAPFKDKRVREAISIAIDRPGMVKGLYGGAAFVLNGASTPGVPGFWDGAPEIKYDPARAKALFAEAGYPDGKGLPPIEISATEASKDELTYYANQFQRTPGLPVSVKVVERATFIRSMNVGEVAFFPWGWTADYPDASDYLQLMYQSASPYNCGRWKNADFDGVMEQAMSTPDDAARFAIYARAEKILMDDWGVAPTPVAASVALTPLGFSHFDKIVID